MDGSAKPEPVTARVVDFSYEPEPTGDTLVVEFKLRFMARDFITKEDAKDAAPDGCDDCVLCYVEGYIEDEGLIGFLTDHDILQYRITRAEVL